MGVATEKEDRSGEETGGEEENPKDLISIELPSHRGKISEGGSASPENSAMNEEYVVRTRAERTSERHPESRESSRETPSSPEAEVGEGRGRPREVKLMNPGGEKKVERRTGDEEDKKDSAVSNNEKRDDITNTKKTAAGQKEVTEESPKEEWGKFPATIERVTHVPKGKGNVTKGISKGKGKPRFSDLDRFQTQSQPPVWSRTRQGRAAEAEAKEKEAAERRRKERKDPVERSEPKKDVPPPGLSRKRSVAPMRIVAERHKEFQRTGVFNRTPYRREKSVDDEKNKNVDDIDVPELPKATSKAGGMRAPPIPNRKSGVVVRRLSEPSRTRFKEISGNPNR